MRASDRARRSGCRVKDLVMALFAVGAVCSIHAARSEAQRQMLSNSELRAKGEHEKQVFEQRRLEAETSTREKWSRVAAQRVDDERTKSSAVKGALEEKVAAELELLAAAHTSAARLAAELDGVQAQLDLMREQRDSLEREKGSTAETRALEREVTLSAGRASEAHHQSRLEEVRQAATQQLGLCKAELATQQAKT